MPAALLIVILLMPNGTYKDFVIHHDSMAACEAAMPEALATVTERLPNGFPYTINCVAVKKSGPAV